MKELEQGNEMERELAELISGEVEAMLREIAEETDAAAEIMEEKEIEETVGPSAEESDETEAAETAEEPVTEEAEGPIPPVAEETEVTDEGATVLFEAVSESESLPEPELTEEEIAASCRQALEELLPEASEEEAPPRKKPPVKAIVLGVAAAVILMIGVAVGGTVMHIKGLKTVYPNVSVMGTELGGMTLAEAEGALERDRIGIAADTAIILKMPGGELELTYADVGLTDTAEEIAQMAYEYGRSDSAIGNAVQYLRCSLFGADLSERVISLPAEEYIEALLGDAILAAEESLGGEARIDPEAQTLTLIKGAENIRLDRGEMLELLMDAIEQRNYGTLTYTPAVISDTAEEITQIREQYCAEVKDAQYNKETGEITEEVIGIAFDEASAAAQWDAAQVGEAVVLDVTVTMPKYTKAHLEEVLFSKVLAESVTTLKSSNANRKNNVNLACQALDGMILMPGEQVDYNQALGQRTPERGYKMAAGYFNGKVVQTYGGGICQVSSALYYCSLLSNLQIDERSNHGMRVNYLPLSYDATVSWGGPELKITNNREYPIRINASADDEALTLTITGTDDGTYVKLSYSSWAAYTNEEYPDVQTGVRAQAVRRVYDSTTNELLKNEKMGVDLYMFQEDQIQYPTPTPSETPTPTPTVTPSVTAEPTPSQSPEDPTPTPDTEPPAVTPTPVPTTATPAPTPTPAPATATPAPTPTPVPVTETPAPTATPVPATEAPAPTATPVATMPPGIVAGG